jgi:hypothetical protein
MASNMKRHADFTDEQLLADAWTRMNGTPRTFDRRASGRTSRIFPARHWGVCGRCGREIHRGDAVRFQKDFTGVVHTGCRAPEVTVTALAKPTVTDKRESVTAPCSDCHLVHAGECW